MKRAGGVCLITTHVHDSATKFVSAECQIMTILSKWRRFKDHKDTGTIIYRENMIILCLMIQEEAQLDKYSLDVNSFSTLNIL